MGYFLTVRLQKRQAIPSISRHPTCEQKIGSHAYFFTIGERLRSLIDAFLSLLSVGMIRA